MAIIEEQGKSTKKVLQWTFIKFGAVFVVLSFAAGAVELMDAEAYRLYAAGKYDECLPLTEKMLFIQKLTLPDDSTKLAETNFHLAMVYDSKGKYADAAPLYDRAIEIYKKAQSKRDGKNTDMLSSVTAYRARNACYLGKRETAKALYRKAIEEQEAVFGKDHDYIGQNLISLAYVEQGDGNTTEAILHLQEALSMKHLSKQSAASASYRLADILMRKQRSAEAESYARQSITIRKALNDCRGTAEALRKLAEVFEQSKRESEGSEFRRLAAEIEQSNSLQSIEGIQI